MPDQDEPSPADQVRDVAAEEQEALRLERERTEQLLKRQRERE